jgi:hypothetical protein
MRDDESLQYFW